MPSVTYHKTGEFKKWHSKATQNMRLTRYSKSMCDKVIELGKQGKTITQMASTLNVSRQAIYEWRDLHPEFAEALAIARTHAQAFDESKLDWLTGGEKDANLKEEDLARGVNVDALKFKIRHQHREDYTETQILNTNTTVQIQQLPDDQINEQLMQKLKLLSPEERQALLPLIKEKNVIEGECVKVEVDGCQT